MKIYYFLNNAWKNSYDNILSKLELLKSGYTTFELINNFYNKVWVFNNNLTNDANFLELVSFIEFLSQKYWLNYSSILEKINFISDENFFIHNEDIYIQNNDNFEKIDIQEKTYFVTSRDSFSSPFFLVLNSISQKNTNIKIVKYNNRLNFWSYNDKSFYLSKIYKYRKKYIWDVVIPLFQNKKDDNIKIFFSYIKNMLWNEVMIKKNFWDMWIWLKALKIDDIENNEIKNLKENFIPENHWSFQWIYIVPYIKIEKEFRVYYRYWNKNDIEIYSVKNRINKVDNTIFQKSNFKIYENIWVEWLYVNLKEFNSNKKYIDFIKKICIKIEDDCWVLEFFEDKNWKIYFCEINSLWGSLMFPWVDQENMMNYYIDTLKKIY